MSMKNGKFTFVQTINIHCDKDPRQGLVNNQLNDWSFKVDGVLHNASQEDVFTTTTTDVVTAALDGYNGLFLSFPYLFDPE